MTRSAVVEDVQKAQCWQAHAATACSCSWRKRYRSSAGVAGIAMPFPFCSGSSSSSSIYSSSSSASSICEVKAGGGYDAIGIPVRVLAKGGRSRLPQMLQNSASIGTTLSHCGQMIACWVCVVNCISAKVLPSTGFLLIIAYCAVERQHARYYREGKCSLPCSTFAALCLRTDGEAQIPTAGYIIALLLTEKNLTR